MCARYRTLDNLYPIPLEIVDRSSSFSELISTHVFLERERGRAGVNDLSLSHRMPLLTINQFMKDSNTMAQTSAFLKRTNPFPPPKKKREREYPESIIGREKPLYAEAAPGIKVTCEHERNGLSNFRTLNTKYKLTRLKLFVKCLVFCYFMLEYRPLSGMVYATEIHVFGTVFRGIMSSISEKDGND